jgi:hypothetical protein
MRTLLLALTLLLTPACRSTPGRAHAAPLLHVVAFDVQDGADPEALARDCESLLGRIPGVTRLRCGVRETLSTDAVVDTAHEVVLVVEFVDRAAHDAYQVHPLHLELVEAWTPRLAGVRVFDARALGR